MKNQAGIGLVEVMVAVLLLAIGILGFIALQVRAVEATADSNQQMKAIVIARDLAERMRANPEAVRSGDYAKTTLQGTTASVTTAKNDLAEIKRQTEKNGMSLLVSTCPTDIGRQCIYIAWDKTAIDFKSKEQCYQNNKYVSQANCTLLEAY
jgi:type IV pilus assembly protein PilV